MMALRASRVLVSYYCIRPRRTLAGRSNVFQSAKRDTSTTTTTPLALVSSFAKRSNIFQSTKRDPSTTTSNNATTPLTLVSSFARRSNKLASTQIGDISSNTSTKSSPIVHFHQIRRHANRKACSLVTLASAQSAAQNSTRGSNHNLSSAHSRPTSHTRPDQSRFLHSPHLSTREPNHRLSTDHSRMTTAHLRPTKCPHHISPNPPFLRTSHSPPGQSLFFQPPHLPGISPEYIQTSGQLHGATWQHRRPLSASTTSFIPSQSEHATLYDALLVDVGGTLLETAQPVPAVYSEFGRKHGVVVSEKDIKAGFKRAFSTPWPNPLRYEGSGEEFWRYAVATAMGCHNEALFQDLYSHFSHGDAWRVAEGAPEALTQLRSAGVKLAIVSNFDTRLRPILKDLKVDSLFDSIIVSCEVLSEKPSPQIFEAALDALDVRDVSRVIHLGDDPRNDCDGAGAMGMDAWLWGEDVTSFSDVKNRILGKTGPIRK